MREFCHATNHSSWIPSLYGREENLVPRRVLWPFVLTRQNPEAAQSSWLAPQQEVLVRAVTVELPDLPAATYAIQMHYFGDIDGAFAGLEGGKLPIQIATKTVTETK